MNPKIYEELKTVKKSYLLRQIAIQKEPVIIMTEISNMLHHEYELMSESDKLDYMRTVFSMIDELLDIKLVCLKERRGYRRRF